MTSKPEHLLRRALLKVRGVARRVLLPDGEEQQRQVRDVARRLARLEKSDGGLEARWQAETSGLHGRLAQQDKTVEGLRRRLGQLQVRLKEQEHISARLLTEGSAFADHAAQHRRVVARTASLAESQRPIVVGPWSGEVGFELLYWIPFLNWVVEHRALDRRRLIVVSRGGAGVWYRHLADRCAETLDEITPDEFRAHAESWKKQHQLVSFDRDLIRSVTRQAGASRPQLLHPSLMYRLLIPYWKEEPVSEPIGSFLRYRLLPALADHPVLSELPEDYVAVKFYFSQAFPDTPGNRAFVASVVDTLSERMPVVLLQSGSRLDDHHDVPQRLGARVQTIGSAAAPRENLALQSAVVGRARGFVGTYGGFSYLAPLYGVSALSFFSAREQLVPFHLEHAQRVFATLGGGRFDAIDVAHADLVGSTLADVAHRRPVAPEPRPMAQP